MPITLDKTIKASDVLTSLTIIVSVIALVVTLTKDRDTRVREQADHVRAAAAKTLAKLERWRELERSLYSELQPTYVETSEMLSTDFNVVKARDSLWKKINAQRVKISDKVLSESIETAYFDLFAYYPPIRNKFLDAIEKLHESEESATSRLLRGTQAAVMSFEGKKAGYSSAMLGNALRQVAAPMEKEFVQDTKQILGPIHEDLYNLISSDDKTILERSKAMPK